MRDALFLAGFDLRHMLREKETLLWIFVMPCLFFWFIGTVTGGGRLGGGSTQRSIALWSEPADDPLAQRIADRLEGQDYRVVRPEDRADFARYRRRLELPDELTARVLEGDRSIARLSLRGGAGTEPDRVAVGRAVYATLADLIVASDAEGRERFENRDELLEGLAIVDARPRALTVETASAGRRRTIPTGYEQTIPGTLVMFTLLILLTSGSVLVVVERRQGVLRRLASAPIERRHVVLGKWLARMGIALVQIAVAMLFGTLVFGMEWGPELPALAVVLVAWAAFCASAGLLLGSLADSEGQAIGFGVVTSLALAALGGCWWPIEITPSWMQNLAGLLPTGWTMAAMHELVSFRAPAVAVGDELAKLAGGAVVLGWLAVREFRFV